MSYTSLQFAAFAAVLILIYYLVKPKFQWIVLTAGSFVFYVAASGKYVVYVCAAAAVTYFAAICIQRKRSAFAKELSLLKESSDKEAVRLAVKKNDSKIRLIMSLSVIFDLGILIVLKYTDFIIFNINIFRQESSLIPYACFVLPLGLSFYTFSAVGYVVDVARSKYDAENNFFKLFLYLTFFPHIIQGPIPRFDKLAPELFSGHSFCFDNIRDGYQLVLWGVFKKLVIADSVAAAVNAMLSDPSELSGIETWIGMIAWGIQLYTDFSGGVDVSRGVSRMLGIELGINFQRPYFAEDLSDYWNRWHISLGNWLKDYLFYPVAFSKSFSKITKATKKHFGKFAAKTVPVGILSLILFTVIGIWHGADWGEVLFGVFNGVVILASTLLEPVYAAIRKKLHTDGSSIYRIFCSIRTFIIITLARVISLPKDLSDARYMYISMFGGGVKGFFGLTGNLFVSGSLRGYIPAMIGCLLLFAVSFAEEKTGKTVRSYINEKPAAVRVILAAAGTAAIVLFGAYGIGYTASDFIYSNY